MKRDLISIADVEKDLIALLELSQSLKNRSMAGQITEPLKGQSLAMIFEKPSTRTRVSFEVAMTELGGHALYLSTADLQLGRGETISDTARVLSRYVDGIVYRAFKHEDMLELSRHSTVPVINALDDLEHPCQILADLLTVKEKKGEMKGLKLAYVGDGNNVCNSLLLGCAILGMKMTVGCPEDYIPDEHILEKAKRIAAQNAAGIEIVEDPALAVKAADVVYTDVWVSMGAEKERRRREKAFRDYQVNSQLISAAKDDCIVMHCLPAHRGKEITDDVIDGPHSVVLDEAENRLHAQKAVLVHLLSGA
jgi:ornithine carbamoyltransferase